MKGSISIFALLLCMGFSLSNASAESLVIKKKKKDKKSKSEKKTAKKKEKQLKKEIMTLMKTPLKYRDMYDEWQSLKGEKPVLERTAESLSNEVSSKKGEISKIEKDIKKTKAEIASRKAAVEKKKTEKPKTSGEIELSEDYTKGTVFKVQIGEIGGYTGIEKVQGAEVDGDQKIKYTLGFFKIADPDSKDDYDKTFKEANDLKDYLRKMKISHATVVTYVDGERLNLKK